MKALISEAPNETVKFKGSDVNNWPPGLYRSSECSVATVLILPVTGVRVYFDSQGEPGNTKNLGCDYYKLPTGSSITITA